MSKKTASFKLPLRGITLTGWQRYDHFAVLCELLPAGIPSLAVNLITVSHGFFNSTLQGLLLSTLSCPQTNSHENTQFINFDNDPHLWDKLGRCMFPGSPFFRLTYRVIAIEREVLEFLSMVKRHKGWLTDYNIRRNYSLPLRLDELTSELPRMYQGLVSIAHSISEVMEDIFDEFTIAEWIEQKIYPYLIELEKLREQTMILKTVKVWPSRPLAPLKDFKRIGISIP